MNYFPLLLAAVLVAACGAADGAERKPSLRCADSYVLANVADTTDVCWQLAKIKEHDIMLQAVLRAHERHLDDLRRRDGELEDSLWALQDAVDSLQRRRGR